MKIFDFFKSNPDHDRYYVSVVGISVIKWFDSYDKAFETYMNWYDRASKKRNETGNVEYGSKCEIVLYDKKEKCCLKRSTFIFPYSNTWGISDDHAITKEVFSKESASDERTANVLAYGVCGIVLAIVVCGILGLKSCNTNYQREQEQKERTEYDKFHPIVIPAGNCDVTEKSDDGKVHSLPAWTNHNGDYKKCRKDLLKRFSSIYDQKKYDQSPSTTYARIKGDTLVLSSLSFREDVNVRYAISEYARYFRDCNFHKIAFMQVDAGGNEMKIITFDENWSFVYPNGKKVPFNKVINDVNF